MARMRFEDLVGRQRATGGGDLSIGAACKLHTTREELVLSFVPAAGTKRVRWDRATIENALRSGFDQAFEDTERRGIAGYVIGHVLEVVIGAPIDFFLD